MADWRSYDGIADDHVRLWAPRFERATRLALAAPPAGGRLLDVGTGTGAVAAALSERVDDLTEVVGCDLSVPMLSPARRRVPRLQVAVAEATRLRFPGESFDVVTASFVPARP
jgi:ubiquinone/menaquinone biosynthesis C-methylase UbiE